MMDALHVVERNIEAWNASDVEARMDTLQFPQHRVDAKGVIRIVDRDQNRHNLERVLGFVKEHEKWDHSVIESAEVVHESIDKMHVSCEFGRYRADGVHYASLKSLWVMVRVDGEWKRSLVSNMPLQYFLPKSEVESLAEEWRRYMAER